MGVQDDGSGDKVALQRFAPLHLLSNTPKGMAPCRSIRLTSFQAHVRTLGRGVFAGRDVPSGSIIETCPVLILDPVENVEQIEKTSLYHYTYNWTTTGRDGKPVKTQAVVFGLGSMFNHSTEDQNVGWKRDLENEVVVYRALRDIQEGEELCISYGDHLTFVDADAPSRKDDMEAAEDLLAKIALD